MRCKPHQWAGLMLIVPIIVAAMYAGVSTRDVGMWLFVMMILLAPYCLFALFAFGSAWRKSAAQIQRHVLFYPFFHTFVYAGFFIFYLAVSGDIERLGDGFTSFILGIVFAFSAGAAFFLWMVSDVLRRLGWLQFIEPVQASE